MLAAEQNFDGPVKSLLDHGADASIKDNRGETALDHINANGSVREMLLKAKK